MGAVGISTVVAMIASSCPSRDAAQSWNECVFVGCAVSWSVDGWYRCRCDVGDERVTIDACFQASVMECGESTGSAAPASSQMSAHTDFPKADVEPPHLKVILGLATTKTTTSSSASPPVN